MYEGRIRVRFLAGSGSVTLIKGDGSPNEYNEQDSSYSTADKNYYSLLFS